MSKHNWPVIDNLNRDLLQSINYINSMLRSTGFHMRYSTPPFFLHIFRFELNYFSFFFCRRNCRHSSVTSARSPCEQKCWARLVPHEWSQIKTPEGRLVILFSDKLIITKCNQIIYFSYHFSFLSVFFFKKKKLQSLF